MVVRSSIPRIFTPSVVRLRGQLLAISIGNAHDDIARLRVERAPEEFPEASLAARVCPGVLQRLTERLRHDFGDFVLKSLASSIRKREVVGIGAYAQRRALGGENR
jgi:hypothetical protein